MILSQTEISFLFLDPLWILRFSNDVSFNLLQKCRNWIVLRIKEIFIFEDCLRKPCWKFTTVEGCNFLMFLMTCRKLSTSLADLESLVAIKTVLLRYSKSNGKLNLPLLLVRISWIYLLAVERSLIFELWFFSSREADKTLKKSQNLYWI